MRASPAECRAIVQTVASGCFAIPFTCVRSLAWFSSTGRSCPLPNCCPRPMLEEEEEMLREQEELDAAEKQLEGVALGEQQPQQAQQQHEQAAAASGTADAAPKQ